MRSFTSFLALSLAMTMTTDAAMKPNRLINEKSPYLLQHAYNPVDWYPWGPEAFEKAKKENKPILVSIGYSTCHWCHVMEHESYEDPDVAALMNKYLVNIKVDREERPDVDKIYMTAVSAMTGQGGWPLNMFLTPDLQPIYGGTYFPPTARWGQPAWKEVVTHIGETWQSAPDKHKMIDAAARITEALKSYAAVSHEALEGNASWLDQGYQSFKATYDSKKGGFGDAPKFPMPVYHNFLLRYYARTHNKEALEMSLHTLRKMAKGGIYDQLGGGFARYSTDENWHVPHFEKMLYDNAQLAVNYLEAYQITHDDDFKRIAQETLAYIQRDMTHPEGGFYSAEDADSLSSVDAKEKTEGAFYVWESSEIPKIIGEKAGAVFAYRYGVQEGGNATHDPHGEFVHKNILYLAHSIPETASEYHLSESETTKLLDDAKRKLFDARSHRPRPHLDDKIISGWNGLMISAFAKAYQVLGEASYLESAQRSATFLRKNLYDSKTRELSRRWRDGGHDVQGIADDYAFVVQGLLDLYEADFDPQWLDWATELTEEQNKRFYDVGKGGFFMTAVDQDKHLLMRVKEDSDNVEPSASSVAVLNLLRLAQYIDHKDFLEAAEKTLKAFGTMLKETPRALPQLLVALDFALTEPRQIVIAGNPGAEDTKALFKVLHQHFIPVKIVILADGGPAQKHLAEKLDFIADMRPINSHAAAYVCIHHACKQPTSDPKVFETLLKSL
jgi:uncharacterized protein YyaL (SSP411 family)